MKGQIHFDGEGHQRPPEDQHGTVRVRQQTIWIDGVKVTARNDEGWLLVAIEATDAVIGYAVTVNGKSLPALAAAPPAAEEETEQTRMTRRDDLKALWLTRKTSGFPWPTWRGFGGGWHMAVFGYPPWVVIPLWKQALGIPLRPWRYVQRVLGVARARGANYHPWMEDDVP